MSAASYPRLVAVNGVLQHPVSRKARRRAKGAADGATLLQESIREAESVSRTCSGITEAVRAFLTAARTGDLIVLRALTRDLEIEARYAAQISENLAERLGKLNAGGGA